MKVLGEDNFLNLEVHLTDIKRLSSSSNKSVGRTIC
jgi:hypothetical protein